MARSKRLYFAAQLQRPLARLLRTRPDVPAELLDRFAKSDGTGERVEMSVGLKLIETAARVTGDPDMGLRSALFAKPGDFEVLEWVCASAATWRDGCETICRYARMLNEAADYRVELCGDKLHVMLGSVVPLQREPSDFQLAAFHLAVQRRIPEVWPELEVWMKHEQPADISAYLAIFPHAKLVFRAAFDGFVYDAYRLDTPLPTADPALHGALRAHADQLLEKIAPGDSLVARTSADILAALRSGKITSEGTAARLGMARRTLVRHLKERGTSYLELLKEARYRTALHYLRNTTHSVEDIAFLLGYSECAPFVRAYKRWSGHAPLEYRRLHARP
jgi:AraC-like DNA-binding protein